MSGHSIREWMECLLQLHRTMPLVLNCRRHSVALCRWPSWIPIVRWDSKCVLCHIRSQHRPARNWYSTSRRKNSYYCLLDANKHFVCSTYEYWLNGRCEHFHNRQNQNATFDVNKTNGSIDAANQHVFGTQTKADHLWTDICLPQLIVGAAGWCARHLAQLTKWCGRIVIDRFYHIILMRFHNCLWERHSRPGIQQIQSAHVGRERCCLWRRCLAQWLYGRFDHWRDTGCLC